MALLLDMKHLVGDAVLQLRLSKVQYMTVSST